MKHTQCVKGPNQPQNGSSKPVTLATTTTIPPLQSQPATGEITIDSVKRMVQILTDDERQLLKDTITHGCWGDGDYEFLVSNEPNCHLIETEGMMGYCTNDASRAGHFQGRKVSSMFRSIYRKMCPACGHKIGYVLSHANNWWGDGTGDMLFLRHEWHEAFEHWAKGGEQ